MILSGIQDVLKILWIPAFAGMTMINDELVMAHRLMHICTTRSFQLLKNVRIIYENLFNLSEFVTTLTELNAMAAEAYMGLSSPAAPMKGYRTPAATGMPMIL